MKCFTYSRVLVVALAVACAAFAAQTSSAQTAASSAPQINGKEILEKFPKSLLSDADFKSRKSLDGRDQLNQRLRDNFSNTTGTVTFEVEELRKRQGKVVVMSSWVKTRVSGVPFNLHHEVEFAPTESEKLNKLRRGDKITVSGKVFGNVYGKTENLFNLWIREATLVK